MSGVESESTVSSTASTLQRPPHSANLTVVIIILNLAVFVLMAITTLSLFDPPAESLIKWGANYGPLTLNGQWWRMFTSLFVHIGVIHILFNMYVLMNIGPFMENVLGSSSYLILYLVSGMGSGAASLWSHPTTISAGASGSIFGLYGGLLAFLLLRRKFIRPEALMSLAKGAIIFIGYNVVFSLSQPEVDLAAHIGGLVSGFLVGLVLVQPAFHSSPNERGARKAIATVFGVGILLVTVVALPKPDDLSAEIKRMSNVETTTLTLVKSSVDNWKAKKLTDQQLQEVLEQQAVPPWRAERERLSNLKGLSLDQSVLTSVLAKYMQAREDSWTLLAQGIRANDVNKIMQSNEKSKQAERLAKEMGAGAKK